MRALQLLFILCVTTACSIWDRSLWQSPVSAADYRLSAEALDEGFAVKLENRSAKSICLPFGDWPTVAIGGILPGVTGGNYVGDTSAAPYVEVGEQKFEYVKRASHLGHSPEQLKIKPSEAIETTLLYADFADLPENLTGAELRYPLVPLSCQ